ncbi:hypothetical protein BCR36DRAFT_583805 [Piromyces finnis]|uniref:Uncharacterized protein n=1 Tax=Piromyces finnis TaxID=1754191 RepID=A0A1Y1V8S7_9FUNG|nr:hypothetical protein BCR36DRAFT_583805 [Piromyces finnis]|eukprot:ORX49752.1 hypothetical protein BCR36DRAFT_583805 [Piromyces finnis]
MSAYPSNPHNNEKDQMNPMYDQKLKGTLNKEMEMKHLTEEVRNEICSKSSNKSGHEFVHEYDKLSMIMMLTGIPLFFRYVKKQIKCKHCKKTFATYIPTI